MNPVTDIQDHKLLLDLFKRIPILMYHKVDKQKEIGITVISPERFRKQMAWLRQAGYQTITFHDLLSHLPLPDKPVIISFDDAYECIYQYVFPVFKEYTFKGVVFTIGGFVNEWNDWDANLGGIRFRHMSEDQLRELDAWGWEIGAHTMTHQALPFLGREALMREMVETRQVLENIIQKQIISVAYPFGLQNAAVRTAARDAGFSFGCKGIQNIKTVDLFQLPRAPVYQFDGIKAFKRKLKMPFLGNYERIKLLVLSFPAILTPWYQDRFKKSVFLVHRGKSKYSL